RADPDGRLARPRPGRHQGRGARPRLGRHRAPRRARHRPPRDRDDHRGRGRLRRLHPPAHRVAGRAPARRGRRGPPRRPAPVPVPVRDRVARVAVARRLRQLAALPVTELRGVGPERARALGEIGIETILDLLTHYPRRYLDKTRQSSIRDAQVDEQLWVFGRVVSSSTVQGRGRGKARTELRITDGSGYLRVTFFNQPWRARQLPEGTEAMFFGKVTAFRGQKQLANPEVDLLDEEDRLEITPIYPQSDRLRLYSRDFRAWL